MSELTCTILMCVYAGDNAAWLEAALASIAAQERQADQFVIVEDGPLPDGLSAVLAGFADTWPGRCDFVRLQENHGLVAALNAGLPYCRCDLVIRMDADDIAHPDRIRVQQEFMSRHPEIGVVGSAMLEFIEDPGRPGGIKPVRETHEEIRHQLPWRNPVNHPTVCMRRDVIPESGYPDLAFVEDYLLWGKLLAAGVRFHNLPMPLLSYRFNDATLSRRGGWVNFRNEIRLRNWLYRNGLCSLPVWLATSSLQLVLRFAPFALRRWLWRNSRQPAPVSGP